MLQTRPTLAPYRQADAARELDLARRAEAASACRAAFVLSLRARGIRDTAVLGAMERVPRELFAPRRLADLARTDVALPLPCGQTMTAPGTVATMLVALAPEAGHRVLEIGTGSGYVAGLLARIGCAVRSVERYATLAEEAAARLRLAGYEVAIEIGDGLAHAGRERFDRILLNGTVAAVPRTLTSLLAPGGRLVAGLVQDGFPHLAVAERGGDGTLAEQTGAPVRLSPLVAGHAQVL